MRIRVLALLLLASLSTEAVVFTLRPGVGARVFQDRLRAKPVLSDTLAVNGGSGTIDIHYSELSWEEILSELRGLLADGDHLASQRSLLIENSANGRLSRHYIVSMGDSKRPVIYSIEIPAEAAKDVSPDQWPDLIPFPTASKVGPVMHLKKRKVDYATFESNQEPRFAGRSYHSQLRANGWNRLEGEAGGLGGTYVKERPTRILLFAVMPGRDGGTAASLFIKTGSQIED
ncbi:MAG: hypothetical protein ACI8W8_003898 [Rhodothermales bacterium]|jgi:hypothetical protein